MHAFESPSAACDALRWRETSSVFSRLAARLPRLSLNASRNSISTPSSSPSFFRTASARGDGQEQRHRRACDEERIAESGCRWAARHEPCTSSSGAGRRTPHGDSTAMRLRVPSERRASGQSARRPWKIGVSEHPHRSVCVREGATVQRLRCACAKTVRVRRTSRRKSLACARRIRPCSRPCPSTAA